MKSLINYRHQLSEISFVLKAIASLTEAMKQAPTGKVDSTAWDKLIGTNSVWDIFDTREWKQENDNKQTPL